MKSAVDLLLYRTREEIWHRGVEYADNNKVEIISANDKEIKTIVKGTDNYQVSLKFSGGGITRKCNCPYADGSTSRSDSCKHMVAVAILWDELSGIERPSDEEIEYSTIAPPLVSRSQITAIYKDPLNADLEVLRMAAEERGSWSRPHSRLPNMPGFSSDKKQPLDIKEAKKAFNQISRWADRRNFDPYFCAGEMVSAYCEVMRLVVTRLPVSSPLISADILLEAQQFVYELHYELIDDSDGLYVFSFEHLDSVYKKLKRAAKKFDKSDELIKKLKEYEANQDDL